MLRVSSLYMHSKEDKGKASSFTEYFQTKRMRLCSFSLYDLSFFSIFLNAPSIWTIDSRLFSQLNCLGCMHFCIRFLH